ncbi:hypothetical protein Tco_0452203 [Tanacetum coccineum]
MYCSIVSTIVFATSSSDYSWSESKLKSGNLNSSRLSVLKCLLDDRNSRSILYDRYAVSNGSGYAVLISLNEYVVLVRKFDTPYPMEVDTPYSAIDQNSDLEVVSIRRIQGIGYGVLGFLEVGTTYDIFQNIHILYLEYGVLSLSGYGILSFIPLWSLVSAGTDTGSGCKKDKTTMGDTLNIKANSTNASADSNSIMEPVDVLQPSIGGSIIPTSLATKICDIEKKMLEGKLVFVNNDGKPLQLKIVSTTKLVFSGSATNSETRKTKVNFRSLVAENKCVGADLTIPIKIVEEVFEECKVDANATTGSSMDKRGKEIGTSEVDAVKMENDNI